MKFHENPSCESRVVPCGQTDGQVEPNNQFSQFCERPSKTSISVIRYVIQWNNVCFLMWSEGLN
jgi:hypothetical protein